MLKKTKILAGWAALCVVLLGPGCNQRDAGPKADTSPTTTAPTRTAPLNDTADASPAPPSKHPLKDALDTLLKEEPSLFPPGTQLKSVKLEEGVATLDFSHAFNDLANMGESGESQAQKRLQQTLAKFPTVQKMRVTVEGRSFDSQATDWNTPFAVRQTGRRTVEPGSDASKKEENGDRP